MSRGWGHGLWQGPARALRRGWGGARGRRRLFGARSGSWGDPRHWDHRGQPPSRRHRAAGLRHLAHLSGRAGGRTRATWNSPEMSHVMLAGHTCFPLDTNLVSIRGGWRFWSPGERLGEAAPGCQGIAKEVESLSELPSRVREASGVALGESGRGLALFTLRTRFTVALALPRRRVTRGRIVFIHS